MSQNHATIKQPGAFSTWYNGNSGQRTVGAFYSLGASVVIIGALFKIMHWPGAGYVLTAGMVTEAILFFIGVFEKPHKNYKWERVYPSLLDDNYISGPVATIRPTERIGITDVASLDPNDAKKLEDGIKQLAETAGQLGNISQAAAKSETFARNLSHASDAVAAFTVKQQSLDEVSASMIKSYQEISGTLSNVSSGMKEYANKTAVLGNNISSINSIYELELKNIQAQAQAISSHTSKLTAASSDLEKLFSVVSSSARDMEVYKEQTEKLARQISALNQVYGDMLNVVRR